MSMNSALKARFARLGPVRDGAPGRSSSDGEVVLVLHRTGALAEPVSLARRLVAAGMTLRAAHGAISRLAERGWAVCPVGAGENLSALAADLRGLNVQARRRAAPEGDPAGIARLRGRLGLSQRAFADLLGFDVRTLQNWEQGRNRPDAAALNLMRVFEQAPDVVERAISEPIG